jgi:hypothetical protein
MNGALMVLRSKLPITLMAVGMLLTTACPPRQCYYYPAGQLVACPPQQPLEKPNGITGIGI